MCNSETIDTSSAPIPTRNNAMPSSMAKTSCRSPCASRVPGVDSGHNGLENGGLHGGIAAVVRARMEAPTRDELPGKVPELLTQNSLLVFRATASDARETRLFCVVAPAEMAESSGTRYAISGSRKEDHTHENTCELDRGSHRDRPHRRSRFRGPEYDVALHDRGEACPDGDDPSRDRKRGQRGRERQDLHREGLEGQGVRAVHGVGLRLPGRPRQRG